MDSSDRHLPISKLMLCFALDESDAPCSTQVMAGPPDGRRTEPAVRPWCSPPTICRATRIRLASTTITDSDSVNACGFSVGGRSKEAFPRNGSEPADWMSLIDRHHSVMT